METPGNKNVKIEENEMDESSEIVEPDVAPDEEDDGTPVLDEEDLEENGITEEEAENIEWEKPEKS